MGLFLDGIGGKLKTKIKKRGAVQTIKKKLLINPVTFFFWKKLFVREAGKNAGLKKKSYFRGSDSNETVVNASEPFV